MSKFNHTSTIIKFFAFAWNALIIFLLFKTTLDLSEKDDSELAIFFLWVILLIVWGVGKSFFNLITPAETIKEIHKEVHISSADELKKWVELRDAGTITEEEFQKKKKELIK